MIIDFDFDFTKPLPPFFIATILIVLFLIVYFIIVGSLVQRIDNEYKIPNKFLQLNILFVKKVNKFLRNTIGINWRYLAPYIYTLIFFIFFSNISSMFGIESPTSNTAITVPLAIFAVFAIQTTGMVSKKHKHVKTLFEPIPFMFPLNVVSDISPILSLSFRLFGNILSGGILLTLIYSITRFISPVITPAFHLIFDLGFGSLQTLVFVLITTFFAKDKTDSSDEIEDTDENFLIEYQSRYFKMNN